MLFCYKNYELGKNNNKKIMTNPFIYFFCWAFALFHQGIVITVTFKMLYTFLSKRQSKRDTIIKFCHSNNSNGKDLTVLFKMGLSRDISKLSLISKLILLESLDKMVKSSKFMLQSQVSKWSVIADCLTFLRCLPNVKFPYFQLLWHKYGVCFAIINSVAAITLKTINDVTAEFFGKHILKMKMVDNFRIIYP